MVHLPGVSWTLSYLLKSRWWGNNCCFSSQCLTAVNPETFSFAAWKNYDIRPDCLRAAVHTNMAQAGSRKYHRIYKLAQGQRRRAGKHAGASRTKSNLFIMKFCYIVPLFYTSMQIEWFSSEVCLLEQSLSLSYSNCWTELQRLVNIRKKIVQIQAKLSNFLNVRIGCFSLSFTEGDEESLGFQLLVGQNKQCGKVSAIFND